MKRLPFLPAIALLFLISCSEKTGILNTNNLNSHFINIDAGKENTLRTPKGAVIKIAANSFDVPAGAKVLIEIKEAYSMNDILKAGLVTESNGKPLKSGGMIFIGATVDGKSVGLAKPIKVSIPTNSYDTAMQVFKGELNEDSSINWVEPQLLDTGATKKQLLLGESLFKSNCASCHKPKEDFTGPALAGSRLRGTGPDWAYRFTNYTNSMIETDPYARYLLNKYGSKMTQFNLPYGDLKAIFDYCDNEYSLNYKYEEFLSPESTAKSGFVNPCGTDTFYLPKPANDDTGFINTITIDNPQSGTQLINKATDSPLIAESGSMEGLRNGFTDLNQTDGAYDFSIETLGWYNIDAYVQGYVGTEYVDVHVALDMPEKINAHVYLFYPPKKMLSVGSLKAESMYHFEKVEGKIPLYLNSNVIVLAFGSKVDRIYYGVTTFKVQKSQTLRINLKETDTQAFKSFIDENNIDGINISLDKKEDFHVYNKNCDTIDKTDLNK